MTTQKDTRPIPLAYLITFTCYGTHLPGSEKGWVDRRRNEYDSPYPSANRHLETSARALMRFPPYYLDANRRRLTKEALLATCATKGWEALALHVRETHVHAVIAADTDPDTVMGRLKADASRLMNSIHPCEKQWRRWTSGGSKRFLWNERQVIAAILYVVTEQGEPMEIYCPRLEEILRIAAQDASEPGA